MMRKQMRIGRTNCVLFVLEKVYYGHLNISFAESCAWACQTPDHAFYIPSHVKH